MGKGDNADVMKHVVKSFVNVITTKTSSAHAWLTMKILLKKLSEDYKFLKYVDIVDKKFITGFAPGMQPLDSDPYLIDFLSEIEDVDPKQVGKAIQCLGDILKKNLGEKAGYYFLREFRDNIGEYYCTTLKNMGVDFRLVELRDDIYGLETEKYTLNEEPKSNIAFIKKVNENEHF